MKPGDRPQLFSPRAVPPDADASILNDLKSSQAHFDRFWGRVPTIHISQRQFTEWGRSPALPPEIENVAEEVRGGCLLPPYDVFAIAIDECDGWPSWVEQRDIDGTPLFARCLGFVVEVADEAGTPSLVIVERTSIRTPDKYKHSHIDLRGNAAGSGRIGYGTPARPGEVVSFTTTLAYRTSTSEGGYVLDERATPTESDQSALKSAAKRTLRRIFSLLYLLNDRVYLPFDPLASANRAARRQAKLDADKHGWNAEHYRIFLRRKRKRGKPGETEHGTATPHAFQEDVRQHRRVYKSGRIAIVKPHVRGKQKPRRPGAPQYDAWGLDEPVE